MKRGKIFRLVGNLFTSEGTVAALFNEWERKSERVTGNPGIDWTGKEGSRTAIGKPDSPKRDR